MKGGEGKGGGGGGAGAVPGGDLGKKGYLRGGEKRRGRVGEHQKAFADTRPFTGIQKNPDRKGKGECNLDQEIRDWGAKENRNSRGKN